MLRSAVWSSAADPEAMGSERLSRGSGVATGILEVDRLVDPFEGNLGHLVHPPH
jgi:hypothetical protein